MIARIDGISLAYDDVGAGTPMVLLHGFPHDRSLWTHQLRALSDRARCIAPDLRGFGASSVAGPYSMDRWADDVALLLDALEIERVVLAGLSMGGYVAFAFWRRHRARVRALVLADTRAAADTDETRAKRRALAEVARAEGSAAVAARQMEGMIGKTTRERRPDVEQQVRAMLERAPVDGIVGALDALAARPDSTPTLATIDVPALVVVGEEDALTPPKEARAMCDAIANCRYEVIACAGHVSCLERPAAFNQVTCEFLAALPYP